jgi:hypothetical protein
VGNVVQREARKGAQREKVGARRIETDEEHERGIISQKTALFNFLTVLIYL